MVGGVIGREILYSEVNLYYDEVMDYSYILHSAVPLVEKFQAVGFEKAGESVRVRPIREKAAGLPLLHKGQMDRR